LCILVKDPNINDKSKYLTGLIEYEDFSKHREFKTIASDNSLTVDTLRECGFVWPHCANDCFNKLFTEMAERKFF
jgi:hypothetical protein